MALKDAWIDKKYGDDILPEDINRVAKAVIDNEDSISDVKEIENNVKVIGNAVKEIETAIFKDVDLTKVTTVTEGEIEITENSLTGITGDVLWKKCVINLTGYVDFEFEYSGIEGCYITINGGYRQSVWGNDGRATFSYKGVINEPLLLEIYATDAIYFTKFNTTTDYEFHNEINSKILKTVDLTKVTTFGTTNEYNEVTFDFIKAMGAFTINVVGYVELEIEPLNSNSISYIAINGVSYKMDEGIVTFKGVIHEAITGRLTKAFEGMRFKKFVTSTDYELHNKVGDIDTALDELHSYAQALIGGATV